MLGDWYGWYLLIGDVMRFGSFVLSLLEGLDIEMGIVGVKDWCV